MILIADMGNTNITFAGYGEEGKVFEIRLESDRTMDKETFCHNLAEKLREAGYGDKSSDTIFEGCCLCSVVPELDETLLYCLEQMTGTKPVYVSKEGNLKGTEFIGSEVNELGNDLVAGAIGAFVKYPMPAIVADLGTATTLTAQDAEGHTMGVSICPGVVTGLKALAGGASKLFSVALNAPEHAIGVSTIESLQSGIVLGAAAMMDGLAKRMASEIGGEVTFIMTGGLGTVIAPHCEVPFILDPDLVLRGIYEYYKLNK